MISLRCPSHERIRIFLDEQARLDFSYPSVGHTASTPPAGFNVDHTHVRLGRGEAVFLAAKAALQRWDQFGLGWVKAWPPETPLQTGRVVAILARLGGLWWLNASRIVYVIDESGPVQRFGFAYGTLPGHAESGEERFLIERAPADGVVWYDILAFSRPRHPLARLGYPLARITQRRFARQSAVRMLEVAGEPGDNPD